MSANKELKVFLDGKEDIFIFDSDQGPEKTKEVEDIWEGTYCGKCKKNFTKDDLYQSNFELYINRKASWLEEGSAGFQVKTTNLIVSFAVSDIEHKKCGD